MKKHNDSIENAHKAYEKGEEMLRQGNICAAKGLFRSAYQLLRRSPDSKLFEAAFLLALCIVESQNDPESLREAEDLLIRYTRENSTYAGIPRECVLAKCYTLMRKQKLARLISKEVIENCNDNPLEKGRALAGATYAFPVCKESYALASEALPILQNAQDQSVAMAIVLEALSRAATEISSDIRLKYAHELLVLVQKLGAHPLIPSVVETNLLCATIHIERAEWNKALQYTQKALQIALQDKNVASSEIAFIHRSIAQLYDILLEPRLEVIAIFQALKVEVSLISDPIICVDELNRISQELEKYGEFRMAVSAQTLALRCLADTEAVDCTEIREAIIRLQKLDGMY